MNIDDEDKAQDERGHSVQSLRRCEVIRELRLQQPFFYIGLIAILLSWNAGAFAAFNGQRKACFINRRLIRCPEPVTEELIIASVAIKNGELVIRDISSQPGVRPRAGYRTPDEYSPKAQIVDGLGNVVAEAKLNFHHRIQVPPDQNGSSIDIYPSSVEVTDPEAVIILARPRDAAKFRVELPELASSGTPGMTGNQSLSRRRVEQELPLPSLDWSTNITTAEPSSAETSSDEGFFNIAIVASGYDAANMSDFDSLANRIMQRISSLQPFAQYNSRTRYHFIRNTESLGCHSGCNGIGRLLCCDSAKVIAAAQEAGVSVDEVIVLDSTSTYSGGGYRDLDRYQSDSLTSYSQVYSGPATVDMAAHEFGHSFANLCDEYAYGSEGYTYKSCVNCRPICGDFGSPSPVCQISCDARLDYYRPENSIMYSLQYTTFNQVSREESLRPRLDFLTAATMPQLTITDVSQAEGHEGVSNFNFMVSLSEPSLRPVSVSYATAGGTAQAGVDYSTVQQKSLVFEPGQVNKTITVSVFGDGSIESNENFFVSLTSPINGVVLDHEGKGVILNDDYPSLKISNASLGEGNGPIRPFNFTLSLTAASIKPVSVKYATVNGTALASTDYVGVQLTPITFQPGETKKQIAVEVSGDTVREANEAFYVRLSSPNGLTLFNDQGTGTILNDDGPVLRINDVAAVEGDEGSLKVMLKLTLAPASASAVSLKYTTVNGTAVAGTDYVGVPLTPITFQPGETTKTILVSLKADRVKENDEGFFVNLSSARGATIFDRLGKVTIQDDD